MENIKNGSQMPLNYFLKNGIHKSGTFLEKLWNGVNDWLSDGLRLDLKWNKSNCQFCYHNILKQIGFK